MAIKASGAITLSSVVDVWSTTRYYLLQSSTQAPPARPTTNPPTGGWDDTEPTYTSGSTNTLYFTDLTVFSDGSWAYSLVSVSSAYEAAKAAWNKAQAAQNAVNALDDSLTQQEIFNRLTDNGAAQGLVMYNGQLYINASYVNAGRMNVGRVDFNEPESYYDVPDENDPDSLLSGQAVADGWIVNTSGGDYITVFSCGFAIPLRGKTVTVTFAFNGTLSGGRNSWTFISDEALQMGADRYWVMPSGTTPNPYTYSVAVPDDAMSFSIAMECAGVKQIEVSLDSPVTPSESIVYNYEGQRIGEGYPFRVYRDGTLITRGKSLFNGVARISKLYLNFPLAVDSGGTGATNAASARANLEITPANIGAVANTDIIDIAHGGTNASSAYNARVNLDAAASVSLHNHDSSRDVIWAEISKIPIAKSGVIYITGGGCYILTKSKLNSYMYGVVSRTNATNVTIVAGTTNAIYTWSITGLDTDNYTVGAITKYTGTVI